MKHLLWIKQADSMPQVQHRTVIPSAGVA
jgi:hypothetical protein